MDFEPLEFLGKPKAADRRTPAGRPRALRWARRLRRVIARIEGPAVIGLSL